MPPKTSQTRTSKPKTSQTRTSKTRTSKPKTSKTRTSKTRTSKPKTSQTRTSKVRTSKTKTSKPKTSQTRTSKVRTSKPKNSQTRTSKVRKSPIRSASKTAEGTVEKGGDGNLWIVAYTKNDIKRWIPKNKSFNKEFPGTPKFSDKFDGNIAKIDDLFAFVPTIKRKNIAKYFLNVMPKIQKENIQTFIIPNPSFDDTFFVDYAWSDVGKIMKEKNLDEFKDPFIFMYLPATEDGKHIWPSRIENIEFQHSLNNKKNRDNVYKIFKSVFGKKLDWDGSEKTSIIIQL